MGITIVKKSPSEIRKDKAKIALVLAGGAITGGAFKVGGLKALNDYLVNKKVTDFDLYVGLSAGAFLAAPLAGGIPPEEMLASLEGRSELFSQLSPFQLYKPNFTEYFFRPIRYIYGHLTYVPGMLYDLVMAYPGLKDDTWVHLREFIRHPSYPNYEQLMSPLLRVMYSTRSIPSIGEIIPSGIFDNAPLEKYIRDNLKNSRMTNNFKVLKKMSGKSLYVTAMDLDTSRRVVFGPDEKNDLTISQAIQASSAIPGFYKPARIKGVDYIDGGVKGTASLDVAFEKGADLVVCYNPFRPFHNEIVVEYLREEKKYVTKSKRISDWGIGMVFNQVFRTLFHSRLLQAVQSYKDDPSFNKDLILIEPKETDSDFFELNPLFFWNRSKAASQGFNSVCHSIDRYYDRLSSILAEYGVEMTRDVVQMDSARMEKTIVDYHDEEHPRFFRKSQPSFRIFSGGRRL